MIHLRRLTADDLTFALGLCRQAGWNQTEADLRCFLRLEPDGCFVAEYDGRPAGTTTTCVFGPVAWVAMVLVDPALRGRGIGTALMRHALAFLDGRGVRSVRLDATPLGQPIYEKLGLVPQFQLARYGGTLPPAAALPSSTPADAGEIEELVALDRSVTGTDRGKWLRALFADQPGELRVARRDGRVTGFLTVRPGARALLVGPCLATDDAGPRLFADAWRRYAGRQVFIDVPVGNEPAVRAVEARGLTVQRPLLRMCRGEQVVERVEALWASSGPELG